MPPKEEKIIQPINAPFDSVAKAVGQVAPLKSINNNALNGVSPSQVAPPKQLVLDLGIEIQRDVNGIEMGVLENGIPFLTQIGLAKIAGVARSAIFTITQEWEERYDDPVLGKDRSSFLKEYLFRNGYSERKLYIETKKDGSPHYAYPDIVCMAVIEYYAFEAKSKSETAVENYRKLAAYGLQKFIYDSVGYQIHDKWKLHNERQSILRNSVPAGYFSVFHEINPLTLDLIHADLPVNDKTVPDISVGLCWADRWKAISHLHGERIPYKCDYPGSYKQSKANGSIEANAYPDSALPEFRKWFREEYLPTKFPAYILKKAKILAGGIEQAKKIANVFQPKQIQG